MRPWIMELNEIQDRQILDSDLKFPKNCVMVGTSGDDGSWRHDQTGNKRYWNVDGSGVNVDETKNIRDKLFAEAVNIVLSDETIECNEAGQ